MEQARGDAKLPLRAIHRVLAAPRERAAIWAVLKGARGWHARRLRLLAWLAILDPGSSVIQHNLALAAVQRGRSGAAMAAACRRLVLTPGLAESAKLMVTVLENCWSGADRLRRLTAQVRRLEIIAPGSPPALIERARLAYRMRKYDEAIVVFLRFPVTAMTGATTGHAYLAAAKASRLSDWIKHVWVHRNFPGRRGALLFALAGRSALKERFDGAVRLYRAARRHGWTGLPDGPGTLLHSDEVIARAGAIVAATPAPPLIDMVAAPPPSAVGARVSSGPPPVVVVAGDDRYLERFLPGLAGSLRQVAGDTPLHVHAMGALRPETTDLLRSAADAISHDRTAERFSRTYYTCGRFLAAPTILVAWRRDLVIVDLDSVFAAAPARLADQLADGDLGFVPNNHVVPWETVDACCLYLKATPSVVAEVRLIADLIAERFAENRAEYYLDQGVLASVRHAARRRPVAPRWRPLTIEGLFVSANAASVEGKARELAGNSA
ncbi:MAG: hypothetical protein VX123_09255 [Pseudomonadota bacterium]|nr:hypothetical protein [Pseudomonadota bacterium]